MIYVMKMLPLHLYYLLKYLLFRVFFDHPDMAYYVREKCHANILFWLDYYVSFPDAPSKIPFIFRNYTYKKEYIRKLADNLKQGKGLIVSKSEDMDTTRLTAMVLLWYWMFFPGGSFAIFARTTRQLCKADDPEAIFNLYRYVLERTPPMLLDSRFEQGKKTYKIIINRRKQFCAMLINYRTGNIIYGYSGARVNYLPTGRKLRAAWFDDMAFHKFQEANLKKLNGVPILATSCPNGTDNCFYDLTQNPALDQYQLHWSMNPEYYESWHKHIIETFDPVYIEQYFNINFEYKYKRPAPVQVAAVTGEEKKPKKPRKPRRKQQSTFAKTFAQSEAWPVRQTHKNRPERPAVISFEEFKKRRQKPLETRAELDTLYYGVTVINVAYGEAYFYNKQAMLSRRCFLSPGP
jgi:hypothetical protein